MFYGFQDPLGPGKQLCAAKTLVLQCNLGASRGHTIALFYVRLQILLGSCLGPSTQTDHSICSPLLFPPS